MLSVLHVTDKGAAGAAADDFIKTEKLQKSVQKTLKMKIEPNHKLFHSLRCAGVAQGRVSAHRCGVCV